MSEANKIDKYLYIRQNPNLFRFLGLLGVVTTLLFLYGFTRYLTLSPYYAIFFGPIIALYGFNRLVGYIIQIFYPKFDKEKHVKFVNSFWKNHKEPSVDIFLPWAGEALRGYEETLDGVKKINYKNKKVYILD